MRSWHKSRAFRESCRYAWRGISYGITREGNLRRQVVVGFVAFFIALILAQLLVIPTGHLALIIVVSALVLVMEMVNTALEEIEDVIHPKHHEAVQRSKDIAAGAVMIASIAAILVGLVVFLPPLLQLVVQEAIK